MNVGYNKTISIFSHYFPTLKTEKYLIKTPSFTSELEIINAENQNTKESHFKFEELRLNRIEPSSISIDDITRAMERQKFLIRPQYQRNEVIDKKKASAIIESILLGIKLPPLFVYKNEEGISEVIDGQQRLLSILGFMGKKYYSESNEDGGSKIRNFKLDLKNSILKHLHGETFSKIGIEYQEIIRNFDLWIIEIDYRHNPSFDSVDLFLRLNYKPYPIKLDSFEMWNSYISRDLIDIIKFTSNSYRDWFYLRKTSTRMENENLISSLLYLYVENLQSIKANNLASSKLDIYKVSNKVLFRLKSKSDVTKRFEEEPVLFAKNSVAFEADFMRKLERLIVCVNDQKNKATALDYILNVEKGRRTQQSLYALFYFLQLIKLDTIEKNGKIIVDDLRYLFKSMTDIESIEKFHENVTSFKIKNNSLDLKQTSMFPQLKLSNLCRIEKFRDIQNNPKKNTVKGLFSNVDSTKAADLIKKIIIKEDFNNIQKHHYLIASMESIDTKMEEGWIEFFMDRPLVSSRYLCGMLNSTAFFDRTFNRVTSLSLTNLSQKLIPAINVEYQNIYDVLFYLGYELKNENSDYFKRIIQVMYDIIINQNIVPHDKIIKLYHDFLIFFKEVNIELIDTMTDEDSFVINNKLKDKNSFLSIFVMDYVAYKM